MKHRNNNKKSNFLYTLLYRVFSNPTNFWFLMSHLAFFLAVLLFFLGEKRIRNQRNHIQDLEIQNQIYKDCCHTFDR